MSGTAVVKLFQTTQYDRLSEQQQLCFLYIVIIKVRDVSVVIRENVGDHSNVISCRTGCHSNANCRCSSCYQRS